VITIQKEEEKMKVAKVTWMAVFIALTVVGGGIKIPAIIGSVALDSFPAIVAAALLGGIPGAIVGGIGHLVSALIGGMPLGPMHFLIAIEMAMLAWIVAYLYQKGSKWTASILFVLGNTFAAPLPFIFLISKAFYISMVPSLLIASVLNTVLAVIVAPRLASIMKPAVAGKFQK
jgi:uncharacterized membrane protein